MPPACVPACLRRYQVWMIELQRAAACDDGLAKARYKRRTYADLGHESCFELRKKVHESAHRYLKIRDGRDGSIVRPRLDHGVVTLVYPAVCTPPVIVNLDSGFWILHGQLRAAAKSYHSQPVFSSFLFSFSVPFLFPSSSCMPLSHSS